MYSTGVRGRDMGIEEGTGKEIGGRRIVCEFYDGCAELQIILTLFISYPETG